MHTSRRDAFQPINNSKLSNISINRNELTINNPNKWASNTRKINTKPSMYDCDLKFTHLVANAHLQSEIIDSVKEKGHAGIILHGTGLGHLPIENPLDDAPENLEIAKSITNYISSGGIALMVGQCINGPINMDVYSKGRLQQELGIIGHPSTTSPDTAAVKLHWILSNNHEEIRELIKTNLCGENPATLDF